MPWLSPAPQALPPDGAPDAVFPTQPAALVKEMVTVAHFDLARVTALVAQHQTLAKAAYDWGFGDWEDALGAASHVGRRDIAAVLLANGARPTMFSAAMLGQVEVLKAFVEASPGVEATPGPHSITLLSHAKAGGPQARATLEYLQTLPASDARPAAVPLAADQLAALAGTYVFGSPADAAIVVTVAKDALMFQRVGGTARGLTHVGDRAFFPMGAALVRIRFHESSSGLSMTVHDPDLVMEARRR
jgi:hypothetical protein